MRLTLGLLFFLISQSILAAPEAVFDVQLVPAGDFKGRTSDIKGSVWVEGSMIKAQDVRVSLKGIKTGIELRDEHTQKHLKTTEFPEAILVHGEGENGKGKGLLRIKGIEREVYGTYDLIVPSGASQVAEVKSKFKIKLSEFGITGIKYMGVGVNDEVSLNITMPLQKLATPANPLKPVKVKK